MFRVTMGLLALVLVPATLLAQGEAAPAAPPGHTIVMADQVPFAPFEVPGFAPGIELAVLNGDPSAETGSYTLRLRFPDGYRFPSHYHPKAENVTVLSGSFRLAMGTDEDPSDEQTYGPGSYLYIPPESPHYGSVSGSTVVQLHGDGPFQVILANTGT